MACSVGEAYVRECAAAMRQVVVSGDPEDLCRLDRKRRALQKHREVCPDCLCANCNGYGCGDCGWEGK